MMNALFEVHILNERGKERARKIGQLFSELLFALSDAAESPCPREGRDMAIVRTKLQEACFFAKRAMAQESDNQQGPYAETGETKARKCPSCGVPLKEKRGVNRDTTS
jgi:hypothetical protein